MFEAKDLSKTFSQNLIFRNVNISCFNGDIVGIRGMNGSGKTTLLRIFAGVLTPDDGEIYLDKKKFVSKGDISFVVNNERSFFWRISVLENLNYFLSFHIQSKSKRIETMSKLLRYFDLDEKKRELFSKLSAGERMKVSLIRSFSKNARIYLFDEVFNSLDENTSEKLASLMKNNQDSINIVVSHRNSELDNLCNKKYEIKEKTLNELSQ